MSQLQLYNTLTKRKEVFKPISTNSVGLYVCGNTVYDYCHIGNSRVFVFFDVVTNYLTSLGYNVTYVRNITDIDDKIIKRAQETRQNHEDITSYFIAALHEDLSTLGINPPTFEPQVTHHIPEIINIIQLLIDKNYAYIAPNGDVYYATNKFADYGKLAHQNLDNLKSGARVEVNTAKHDVLDFVLWKMAKPHEPSWPSPWGAGRPGWHIECSAMAHHYLGKHFDIHGGGADLQFPHHQNEVAQAEAAYDCQFVNYWMHVGFVSVNHEKMSKSLGNFFTLREVLHHYHPEVIRYFLLTSHYRSPLNYSTEQLDMAQASLSSLYTALRGLGKASNVPALEELSNHLLDKIWQDFQDALNDDFNIPLAFSHMFSIAHIINKSREIENNDVNAEANVFPAAQILKRMGAIFNILQNDPEEFFQAGISDDNAIQELIESRLAARRNKDWKKADEIRNQLKEMGIVVEDTAQGTTWKKIKSQPL